MCNKFNDKSGKLGIFKVSHDLHFTIRYYRTYEAYDWQRFYEHEDYGEVGSGLVRGDRIATLQMLYGFVYVFRTESNQSKLAYTYRVNKGMYTQIEVTSDDVSHKKAISNSREYMVIKDYFRDIEKGNYPSYNVIVSEIALSKDRLFTNDMVALIKNPRKRGKDVTFYRWKLTDEMQECRTGKEIHEEWNKKVNPKGVTLDTYDILKDTIGGLEGFHLLVPDIHSELRRRNQVYRTRLKKYHKWLNDLQRTQKAFVHQVIKSILNQDRGKESYINKAAYDKWRDNESEQFRKHFFPVHYAIENLIDWLTDDCVKETLRDYSFGNDRQQEAGLKLYHDGIKDIFYTEKGTEYLGKEYDDKESYLAQTTRLLALKPEYSESELFSNSYLEIRKWNHVTFAFLEDIAPVLIAKWKAKSLISLIELIQKKTGYVLEKIRIKPINRLQKTVEVVDVDHFLQKAGKIPDSKGGRGIIFFVEVANIALAIYGLCKSESGEEYIKNSINLMGAALDFGSSNWIAQGALKRKYGGLTGGKLVSGMVLISGIVDCILGIWEAKKAWKEGEVDVAIGWSFFALGGAVVALGAGIKIFGTKATVASGGTLAKPGVGIIVLGLIVEGIGLGIVFFCNNDEIEDWLNQCEFGRKPSGKSIKEQIQDLNDIMCKLEVDAKFEDVPMKFDNSTYVTFIIEPRVITDNSRITFSNLRGIGEARLSEYIFGNRHDLVSGIATPRNNPVLDLSNPYNCTVSVEDGRITKVETTLAFGMDIDKVKGEISLDINNGTLQGYKTNFTVKV